MFTKTTFRANAAALAGPLAVTSILFVAPPAEAADRFAVIGVENSTNVTVRMDHRWGEGQWATDVLSPGTRRWFSWEFSVQNQDQNPPFHVRFDSDLSPGKFEERYHLMAFRAPVNDWPHAHKYIFRFDGNQRFIELYDEKK
jgi:hypothetical protein